VTTSCAAQGSKMQINIAGRGCMKDSSLDHTDEESRRSPVADAAGRFGDGDCGVGVWPVCAGVGGAGC
jgi:hypothetical protein